MASRMFTSLCRGVTSEALRGPWRRFISAAPVILARPAPTETKPDEALISCRDEKYGRACNDRFVPFPVFVPVTVSPLRQHHGLRGRQPRMAMMEMFVTLRVSISFIETSIKPSPDVGSTPLAPSQPPLELPSLLHVKPPQRRRSEDVRSPPPAGTRDAVRRRSLGCSRVTQRVKVSRRWAREDGGRVRAGGQMDARSLAVDPNLLRFYLLVSSFLPSSWPVT